MAVTLTSSLSLSPQLCLSKLLNPKPSSSLRLEPIGRRAILIHTPFRRKATPIWRLRAAEIPVETPQPETAQQIVSAAGDDGVSTIISALLFAAFVVLSVLTVGVVYIAISDFLQKRETEKFEKEEEATGKKKGGKKKKSKARAGPRGFGQKPEEDFGDDD